MDQNSIHFFPHSNWSNRQNRLFIENQWTKLITCKITILQMFPPATSLLLCIPPLQMAQMDAWTRTPASSELEHKLAGTKMGPPGPLGVKKTLPNNDFDHLGCQNMSIEPISCPFCARFDPFWPIENPEKH